MNRRIFLNTLLGATVAGTAAATACAYGEDTHDVEVTRVPISLGLQTPLRMVALGDIHFDPICDKTYLNHVVDLVNAQQPDLLVFTGDFVSWELRYVPECCDVLARAKARLGVYTIPGNHELWTNVGFVTTLLQRRAGIRMLRNLAIPLPGEDAVYLTGLDSFSAGKPHPELIDRTPPNARHILLVHEPDPFAQLTDSRIKLQISGHTHGGQVRMPLYGALVLPSLGRDYQQGLYTSNDRHLYVNRGIGTLVPHVRINCRPEITVFELT